MPYNHSLHLRAFREFLKGEGLTEDTVVATDRDESGHHIFIADGRTYWVLTNAVAENRFRDAVKESLKRELETLGVYDYLWRYIDFEKWITDKTRANYIQASKIGPDKVSRGDYLSCDGDQTKVMVKDGKSERAFYVFLRDE